MTIAYYMTSVDLMNQLVRTNDPKLIAFLLERIKEKIPTVEIRDDGTDLFDNIIQAQFHRLQGKDGEVYLWITAILAENGWEPYAVTPGHELNRSRFYPNTLVHHFRKVIFGK